MCRVAPLLLLLSCVACSSTRRDVAPICQGDVIDLLALEPWEPPTGQPELDPASLASRERPIVVTDAGLFAVPDGVLALRCGERDAGEPDNDCELVIASGARALWVAHLFTDAESTPAVDTYALFEPRLFDATGDGQPELVLSWRIMGEPLPAVGPQASYHLAIVSTPGPGATRLETLYGPVPTTANGAGGLDYCECQLELRRCGGRAVIDRLRRCQAAICVDPMPDLDPAICPGWETEVTHAVWSGKRFE